MESAPKIISTIELNGIEKCFCAHGGWMTIAHVAHLTGDRSVVTLNGANVIKSLLKRYPVMRSRIRVDGNHYLLEIPECNIEYLSTDLFFSSIETEHDTWQDIVENRCNQNPYSSDKTILFPLFHFMFISHRNGTDLPTDNDVFHLVLFSNHSVSDGKSGYVLINEFLTLATSTQHISDSINNEVIPSIGTLVTRPFSFLYPLISFIARQFLKYELPKLAHPVIPVKPIPLDTNEPTRFNKQLYKIKFLFSSTSLDLYSNLRRKCHSHGVTLHGPLYGCVLLTLHRFYLANDNSNELTPFAVGVPVDMRSRLPLSPLTSLSIGLYTGFSSSKLKRALPLRSTRFWSLAHECMTITRQQLDNLNIPLRMSVFADIVKNEHFFNDITRRFPGGRTSEFSFSNIGKYPFSCNYNQNQIQLRGMHVVNNASLYRTSVCLFVTCAGDGQFDISLAQEMESDTIAEEFLKYYQNLIEICGDDAYCADETTLDELLRIADSLEKN